MNFTHTAAGLMIALMGRGVTQTLVLHLNAGYDH